MVSKMQCFFLGGGGGVMMMVMTYVNKCLGL